MLKSKGFSSIYKEAEDYPDYGSGQVSIVNVITNTVVKTVGGIPNAYLAVYDPQDDGVFVSSNVLSGGFVYTIDGGGNVVAQFGGIDGGFSYPAYKAYDSNAGSMWVVAHGDSYFYQIGS